jgi:hypothetical protein
VNTKTPCDHCDGTVEAHDEAWAAAELNTNPESKVAREVLGLAPYHYTPCACDIGYPGECEVARAESIVNLRKAYTESSVHRFMGHESHARTFDAVRRVVDLHDPLNWRNGQPRAPRMPSTCGEGTVRCQRCSTPIHLRAVGPGEGDEPDLKWAHDVHPSDDHDAEVCPMWRDHERIHRENQAPLPPLSMEQARVAYASPSGELASEEEVREAAVWLDTTIRDPQTNNLMLAALLFGTLRDGGLLTEEDGVDAKSTATLQRGAAQLRNVVEQHLVAWLRAEVATSAKTGRSDLSEWRMALNGIAGRIDRKEHR